MAGSGTRHRSNTPRTTTALMFYLLVTAIFDLFVYITLHGRGVGLLAFFAGITDFMSKFVPAIDGTRDFTYRGGAELPRFYHPILHSYFS